MDALGYWTFSQPKTRLFEKHSVRAFRESKNPKHENKMQFQYDELVYCDQPSIARFVDLVEHRKIVFEFFIARRPDGSVKNRGYPWRLIRAEFLDQLFAFQIKLR